MIVRKCLAVLFVCVFVLSGFPAGISYAATAGEINERVDRILEELNQQVQGAEDTLAKAKGVLIFPGVWKAGIGLGGEYGEGALRVDGETVDYYSVVGGSLGFQLGVQKKAVVLAFMEKKVFEDFRISDGWEFGLDGSAALVKVGIDGSIDSLTHNEPIITFVIAQKGLMYNLTLEGYKITKIKK